MGIAARRVGHSYLKKFTNVWLLLVDGVWAIHSTAQSLSFNHLSTFINSKTSSDRIVDKSPSTLRKLLPQEETRTVKHDMLYCF